MKKEILIRQKGAFVFYLFLLLGIAINATEYKKIPPRSGTIINKKVPKFPYKKSKLTEEQAAAHLISRFTFGATPGMVNTVISKGMENWFKEQLQATNPDDSVNRLLDTFETLKMSNRQIAMKYINNNRLKNFAYKEGWLSKDCLLDNDKKNAELYDKIRAEHNLKKQDEQFRQLIIQKIVRAAYSENQLLEVMTGFWFNHFNVYMGKEDCNIFMTSYERDVIRKNALGKFETLLRATAKSPAMLAYLDNRISVANDMEKKIEWKGDSASYKRALEQKKKQKKGNQGLNENYAREIMELHTLGVDGGYTQADVTNAAKLLTGWTIFPLVSYFHGYDQWVNMLKKSGEEKFIKDGNVHDSDFLFLSAKHDKSEKKVLGVTFPENGGIEEGERFLTMLAHHPSCAKFICRKLAVYFVSENPSKKLLAEMEKTFQKTDGDIRQVLLSMVEHKDFWDIENLRAKIKSPFELTISTVRGVGATVNQPYQLFNWITKMGEKIYYYIAPTGFPDRSQYWINSGSLLNRMNFGMAFATQRIPGVNFNLGSLNNNHEPESTVAALEVYSKLLMPGRDVTPTVSRLTPLLNDPEVSLKITKAVQNSNQDIIQSQPENQEDNMMMSEGEMYAGKESKKVLKEKATKRKTIDFTIQQLEVKKGNTSALAQVTGIIIGSPEFQRR